MLDREFLEAEALKEVCACQYYELADFMDVTTDAELIAIIGRDRFCDCEHE